MTECCSEDEGVVAPQEWRMPAGATRNIAVSFVGQLDTGELLTGTPTVAQVDEDPDGATDLTISNNVVSTAELTINEATVAIGKAVQFKVVAPSTVLPTGTEETTYRVKITCGTTATPAQTLIGFVDIIVVDHSTIGSEDEE